MWETINSNAPGQIKPSRQSTAAGLRLCCAFLPVSTICATMLGQNHIAEPTQHVLIFLHAKFVIYCTSGVALTNLSMTFSSTIGHCISIKFKMFPINDLLNFLGCGVSRYGKQRQYRVWSVNHHLVEDYITQVHNVIHEFMLQWLKLEDAEKIMTKKNHSPDRWRILSPHSHA